MPWFVTSRRGIRIRLSEERWEHILAGHGELADLRAAVLKTIGEPERILVGNAGELLAVREVQPGKWLVAIYREAANEGFVITALLTRRTQWLEKRVQQWP